MSSREPPPLEFRGATLLIRTEFGDPLSWASLYVAVETPTVEGFYRAFWATSMSPTVPPGPLTMTPQEQPDSAVRAEAASASGGRNTRMVVVAGHVTVEPEQRESYLAASVIIVEQARTAPGCLEVAITADLVDPGRVNIYERWESQAELEAFRRSGPAVEHDAEMLSVSMAEYDIAGVRPLFGGSTE